MALYAIYPGGPEVRTEKKRNFAVMRADNPEQAIEAFWRFIGENFVSGFAVRELRDDDSFSPFLVETSHVPVGAGYGELTSGGDRLVS